MTQTCRLERLRIKDFRNYDEALVEFGPGLNVITGRNAQGKTNLIEAVASLALTRSPRAGSSAELLRWGTLDASVTGRVTRPSGALDLELRLHRESPDARVTRASRIDGKPRNAREILGLCPVVLFSPDDLQLVKGSPEGRRRRLDMMLSQLDAQIAVALLRYRRALEQRNALLRHGRVMGVDGASLQGFTEELVRHGAVIRSARVRIVAALSRSLRTALADLSGTEVAELRYLGGVSPDVEGAESELRQQLQDVTAGERVRGVTLAGPHRDDVEIILDDHPARTMASQGQQRSLVLALALAEVRHVREQLGVAPLLLLDDVLSELDRDRRTNLLQILSAAGEQQVFVTTSEPDVVENFGGVQASVFTVSEGTVTAREATAV